VAPALLLKSVSGLFGQFLAVTGRGLLTTYLLLVVHWCVGLPATYAWAVTREAASARDDGSGVAVALMQAHTAAWLVATGCFGACYLRLAASAWPGGVPVASPVSNAAPRPPAPAGHPLAVPLLEKRPEREGPRAGAAR
jgi:hypothetical protein